MTTRVPMTPTGAKALRETLTDLKKKLGEIPDKIAHARGFGDLSENAEYSSAKEEQKLLMSALKELNIKLRNSNIIDPTKLEKTGRVVFSTTVHLQNMQTKKVMVVQIAGEDEANIEKGKISVSSPIARGVIGKMQGDCVEIQTLEGSKLLKILKVEYI